jgi:calcium/calmodulin-dependent protein kinase I
MRCMDHKGVLKLYEVFENNAYVFLVCELLEGGEFFH